MRLLAVSISLVSGLVGCSAPASTSHGDTGLGTGDAASHDSVGKGTAGTPGAGRTSGPARAPGEPPAGAPYDEWLRWAVKVETYAPISTAECKQPTVTLIDEASRRYLVHCKKAEFEMSAQCQGTDWNRCLRSIDTWRILDDRLEAMRKLAEKRDLGIGPGAPHCKGAIAMPTTDGPTFFDLNCNDGYARLEVVCPELEVNDHCKVFVRNQERLPYGHR